MAKNDEKRSVRCSFCGKHQDQVRRLIAGPGAYICNECVPVSYTHLDVYKRQGYKLPAVPQREEEENDVAYGYRLLETCAQKRGMRISGGEFDTERMARVLLDEYRGGKLGRFTLEQTQEN